jgi:transposase
MPGMKAYAQELRDRVLSACDRGQPTKQVARRFEVSPAWVRRLKQRRRETGETTPRPSGGRRFGKVDPEELLTLWAQQKDRTLEEYRHLLAARGTQVCGQTVSRWLIRLGLRYKKSP